MCDPNVFAVLIPCDRRNLARDAFRLNANADCYHKPAEGIAEEPTISSRETTPATRSSLPGSYDSVDHILLTFDTKPKDPHRGWQLGTNLLSSDVLLGHRGTGGVSRQHLYVTINDRFRVELHDNSTYGTAVGYDGEAKGEVRKKDIWLLSFEPGRPRRWDDVTIYVPDAKELAFKIEFPNHEAAQPEYVANLRAFVEESKRALPSINALGLDSDSITAAPSRPRTPHQWPIYLEDGLIGRGEFGEVHRVINARNGDCYAAKKFQISPQGKNVGKKRKLDEEHWLDRIRNEIAIMKENPHPNIMQVVGFNETPKPVLVMPYYPLGNLHDLRDVSQEQYVRAFRQVLTGLRHLHKRGVAHRDLKPENFLVAAPFTIIIADFGLSKVATDRLLTTFCGTHLYAAPEVYPGNSGGYGPSVDIWSMGVIFLALIYDPPARPNMEGVASQEWDKHWSKHWSKALVKKVNFEDEDQMIDILIHMVRINPEERYSADQCLERGCSNGLFRRRHDGHIVDADDASENNTEQVVDSSDDEASDDGITTPKQQSALGPQTGADNALCTSTILDGSLGGRPWSGKQDSVKSQTGHTRGSNLGPPTRRRRTSCTSSWSWTVGPSSSSSGSVTGLFVKRDCFTSSLGSDDAVEDEAEEKGPPVVLAVPEPEPEIGAQTASFEKRVTELLA